MDSENLFKPVYYIFLVAKVVVLDDVPTAFINEFVVESFEFRLDVSYEFVLKKTFVFAFKMDFAVADQYYSIQRYYLVIL